MDRLIFLLLAAAVVSLSQTVMARNWKGKLNWRRMHSHFNCFPDNAAKARCFAEMPNAGHNAKTWLKLFLPQPEQDSYVFNGSTSLDMEDFIVERIEEDPKYICQAKDKFVAGLHCLVTAVTTKCPWLPKKMSGIYIDMAKGMEYICSRIHKMDSVCLHSHFASMKPCKRTAYRKMKQDFDKAAGNFWRKAHRHFRHGKGFTRPGSDRTSNSSSHHRWGFGNKNFTSSSNRTTLTNRGWWKGPRNVTNNGTMSNMSEMRCRFKYVMLTCVRDTTANCHGDTAEIMHDFMLNMYSPECKAKIEEWEEAHVLEQVSDCHGDHCDAAWRLSAAPWQGLLLCLLVFLMTTL